MSRSRSARDAVHTGGGLDRLVKRAIAKAESAVAEAKTLPALSTIEQNFRTGEAWLHMTITEQSDLIEIIGWRREEIEAAAQVTA